MKSLTEELLDYFNNTPKDVLDKDWEAIHSEFAYGLEATRFIKESKRLLSSRKPKTQVYIPESITESFVATPEFDMAA